MANELRETATNGLRRGDLVRKGNGSTIWRVWGIDTDGAVSVVKASTVKDPTRGTFHAAELFTSVAPDLGKCECGAARTGETVDGAPDSSSAPEVIVCVPCRDKLDALVELSQRVNDWESSNPRQRSQDALERAIAQTIREERATVEPPALIRRRVLYTEDGLDIVRPLEDSDTLELYTTGTEELRGVVQRTTDCTGDLVVSVIGKDGSRVLHVQRVKGTDYAAARAVVNAPRPVSALEGHDIWETTSDRARALGALVTVACTCTRTQYTAEGLERATQLHDESARDRESSRARRAAEEIHNHAVLTARYADTLEGELFPLDIVEDATGEILRLDVSTLDDDGSAEYRSHAGAVVPTVRRVSLVEALELDELCWTTEAAEGRAQLAALAAPAEEPTAPTLDDDAPLAPWELELLGASVPTVVPSPVVELDADSFPRPQSARVFGRPVPVSSVRVLADGSAELWLAGGICLAITSVEELRSALEDTATVEERVAATVETHGTRGKLWDGSRTGLRAIVDARQNELQGEARALAQCTGARSVTVRQETPGCVRTGADVATFTRCADCTGDLTCVAHAPSGGVEDHRTYSGSLLEEDQRRANVTDGSDPYALPTFRGTSTLSRTERLRIYGD